MVKQRKVCKNDKKKSTSFFFLKGGYNGSFYVKDYTRRWFST